MTFGLNELHAVALNAFDEMEEMAVADGSSTWEFTERQFVFMIDKRLRCGVITQGRPLWTALEYQFPGKGGLCDIAVRTRVGDSTTMGWIEVKSTGKTTNNFSNLGWTDDFRKLRGFLDNALGMSHCGVWVWLYQFDTYQRKVRDRYGDAFVWSQPCGVQGVREVFGTPAPRRVDLPCVLAQIEADAQGRVLASVRPRVKRGDDGVPYSALLVTAMVRQIPGQSKTGEMR